jgi:hypothetical protein
MVMDALRTNIVQHFTPHNSRNFTWSKKFADYPDAYRVSFYSELDDYKQVERIVCDDGFTESTATKFEKVALWGVTHPSLVHKHTRFQIAANHLRTELYTFEASAESIVCEPGDLIVVTHDVPMWGLNSGRVVSVTYDINGNATQIELDNDITQEAGKSYSVRYRRAVDNTSVVQALMTVEGESRILVFASPVAAPVAPAVDDLVLFGETGSESVRVVVSGIEVGEDMTATLTCIDEAPDIYNADSETIPAWDAHISFPPSKNADENNARAIQPINARPQPPTYPNTKRLTTLSDTVDFNGQYGIYNGVRYRGTMPNTWVLDDKSAITANLSNDSHVVPTDAAGNNGNYAGCSTTMSFYLGGTDDSANWLVIATPSNGVTGSLSDKTYTVTNMTVDSGYVDLTASRTGYSSKTLRFSISKAKSGIAYQLIVSAAAINKSQAGVYTPSTVTASAQSIMALGGVAAYSGRFDIDRFKPYNGEHPCGDDTNSCAALSCRWVYYAA